MQALAKSLRLSPALLPQSEDTIKITIWIPHPVGAGENTSLDSTTALLTFSQAFCFYCLPIQSLSSHRASAVSLPEE